MLLFYATPGFIVTEPVVEWAGANIRNLDTIALGPGGHFVQELYPEAIGEGIVNWLERLSG